VSRRKRTAVSGLEPAGAWRHSTTRRRSRDFHGTEVAFERDRWRGREPMRVGHSTLRVTKLQGEAEAEEVAEAIGARLEPD
jgi:hypothetical protein